jgi:hypothetical protein
MAASVMASLALKPFPISILGSIEVPRCEVIFSLQSNGQENKEDPNLSAFRIKCSCLVSCILS